MTQDMCQTVGYAGRGTKLDSESIDSSKLRDKATATVIGADSWPVQNHWLCRSRAGTSVRAWIQSHMNVLAAETYYLTLTHLDLDTLN
jgi:hypothetical protein